MCQFRVAVQEAADRPPHGWKHQREKDQTHDEEGNLRHDRNQDTDDPENEEEDGEHQVARFASPGVGALSRMAFLSSPRFFHAQPQQYSETAHFQTRRSTWQSVC